MYFFPDLGNFRYYKYQENLVKFSANTFTAKLSMSITSILEI